MDWYTKYFADWGVDPSQEYADAGHERYVNHTTAMKSKGWSSDLVRALQTRSKNIADNSEDAAQYWSALITGELQAIKNAGIDPSDLAKISSHVAFLASASDAAGTYNEVLEMYSPHKIAEETIKQTAKDVEKKLDPKKSWIPWAVGASLFYLIFIKK